MSTIWFFVVYLDPGSGFIDGRFATEADCRAYLAHYVFTAEGEFVCDCRRLVDESEPVIYVRNHR